MKKYWKCEICLQSENSKKYEKKLPFFFKSENSKIFFVCLKNGIILVLPFEEISLWPELSSPTHLELLMDSPQKWRSSSSSRTCSVFNWMKKTYKVPLCSCFFSLQNTYVWYIFISGNTKGSLITPLIGAEYSYIGHFHMKSLRKKVNVKKWTYL